MPVCTLHLLSISSSTSDFFRVLKTTQLKPLVISRVVRWLIVPEVYDVDKLLEPAAPWHLLLVLVGQVPAFPPELERLVQGRMSINAGVPSRIVHDFQARNARLLKTRETQPPDKVSLEQASMARSAQNLEMSAELQEWVNEFSKTLAGRSPVSMLNLLAFHAGKKDSYLEYGKAFAHSIGSRHGGQAKIVGNVIRDDGAPSTWDEIAIAQYPSITHFANMLASDDYQAVNKQYRIPALKDTCILCTTEIDLEGEAYGRPKL